MNYFRKGFIPVMLTPFSENREVDYDGLTRLTEFYLASGATGLFANCLSSEMFELTPQERIKITQHVVKVVSNRVPVVSTGTFGSTVQEQADFIHQIYQTGVQAVIMITGLLANEDESNEVFNERVFDMLHRTDKIPLGFYECPIPYKRMLSPQQLKLFIPTGRITYHKDTCLNIEQVRAKVAAGKGYAFGLYDAYLVHAVESLKAGSAGLSCIQGNFFPELIVWLCQNCGNSQLEKEVQKVQNFLTENMGIMHTVYPLTAKYFLQKLDINISTFTRRETGLFSVNIKNDIDRLYDDYVRLQEELTLTVT
ncbi:dihydrodipicolinate synthase family protein [Tunicatimonas pelagia]|uniref:dihydrodipicolinate synthase family protein n=1 Tax=Tunicatimonas pelagia TaxID=931531 RepID=UPI0026655134|nr:dihydrodipicolinate synthase family protein [Tunicatimonas pelagia]WKN42080.1 dihydrodipicolinate synthase family protein [Tunicatimonas pelagia]